VSCSYGAEDELNCKEEGKAPTTAEASFESAAAAAAVVVEVGAFDC